MKHRRQYPGATPYQDRHGKRRWRFRRAGRVWQLGTEYGSPQFVERYEAAVREAQERQAPTGPPPGSIDALFTAYRAWPEFRSLAPATQSVYRRVLDDISAATLPGYERRVGLQSVRQARPKHIRAIIALKAETPAAARRWLSLLRITMQLAVDLDWRDDNPCRDVRAPRYRRKGFHTWTEDEVTRFLKVHRPGSLAHLAMTLMLYTGARRSDAVRLGWGNVKAGRIWFHAQKTQHGGGYVVDLPIHPELARALHSLPRDAFTFLQTQQGRSRSSDGLGNLMREWCDKAGLPECSSHGLRKAIARRLAEAGAKAPEIMATGGWKSLRDVETYIAAFERTEAATRAIARLTSVANPDKK
ncbi:MAG: tyrosine-type recombinase/integrase [Pseudomonadota bacterium]